MAPSDFAEYFSDDERNARTIFPGLAEYYAAPSAANARALLRSLGLPLPYAALNASLAAARRAAPGTTGPSGTDDDYATLEDASRSGGGRRGRGRRSRGSASRPAPDFFELHALIDLLHDLLPAPPNRALMERLCARARASPALAAELSQLVADVRRSPSAIGRANRRLAEIAETLAGLPAPRAQAFAFDPDHRLSASELDLDLRLHAAVREWFLKPTLEIVLDGVFRDVALPRADRIGAADAAARNTAVNDTEVARSLTLCAFVQLALADWDTARPGGARSRPTRPRVGEVRFLVGDFQTLDVPGADDFVARWIAYVRDETAYFSHLPPTAIGTRRIGLADFPPLADTPFANVAATPSGLRVKLAPRPNATGAVLRATRQGVFVPYGRRRKPFASASAPAERPGASLAERFGRELFTSNPKDWLRFIFQEYGDEHAPTPESDAFAETLAIVNGFRDAIRAEVALARGAVYLTIDALALVYYEARRAALGAAPGDGWLIRPSGPENLAIRCYALAPAGASRKRRRRRARRRPRRKAATPPDVYEDYEDDKSEEITDPAVLASVAEYYAKPSIANALALLRAMGMARPYASLAGDGEGPEEDAPPPDEHAGI